MVDSGEPVVISVNYVAQGATYDDITFSIPLPANASMISWTPLGHECTSAGNPLVLCDGLVFTATLSLPVGIWNIAISTPLGTSPDGSTGPVMSNSIIVIVSPMISIPIGLTINIA
jgi:hypothetical protein